MNHLLLLHGALGAASQYRKLTESLQKDFMAHAMDFDGHGDRIAANDRFRTSAFVDNVLECLNHHDISRADIFGYSMGGFVALELARDHPDRVGRIFTLGTKVFWTPEEAARESKMLIPQKIIEKVPEFARSLKERHTANHWQQVLLKTAEMLRDLGERNPLNPDALAQIGCRIRIGIGDRDSMVSLSECERAYRSLPNSELQVMPGTNHHLERVSVSLLSESIRRFFLKSDPS